MPTKLASILLAATHRATGMLKETRMADTLHEWTRSTLGHGETMCVHCGITNREAAVLQQTNSPCRPANPTSSAPEAREICCWCSKSGDWPAICKNTRDMEDRAASGDLRCLRTLVEGNLGERGVRYVVLNYIASAEAATHRATAAEAQRDRYSDILMVVAAELELPRSDSGPPDDVALYERALASLDALLKQTEAQRVEHSTKRFEAEAEAARLREAGEALCVAIHSFKSPDWIVQACLRDRAKEAELQAAWETIRAAGRAYDAAAALTQPSSQGDAGHGE